MPPGTHTWAVRATRDGSTESYADPLAQNVNQPGAAEGPGFRHQTYEPVPIGYAIQDEEGTVYAAWMRRKPTVHDTAMTGGDGPRMHHVAFATHEKHNIIQICDKMGALRISDRIERPLRDLFDVPDLAVMDDAIVNGTYQPPPGAPMPRSGRTPAGTARRWRAPRTRGAAQSRPDPSPLRSLDSSRGVLAPQSRALPQKWCPQLLRGATTPRVDAADVAKACLFLASEGASFITGSYRMIAPKTLAAWFSTRSACCAWAKRTKPNSLP